MRLNPHSRTAGCILAWLLLGVTLPGCNSVYHKARADVPAGREATLALRLGEARAAEAEAVRIATLLRDEGAGERQVSAARLDQLEVAASDLDRKVLSIKDAAAAAGAPEQRELSRLESSGEQLQKAIARGTASNGIAAREAVMSWLEHATEVAGGRYQ